MKKNRKRVLIASISGIATIVFVCVLVLFTYGNKSFESNDVIRNDEIILGDIANCTSSKKTCSSGTLQSDNKCHTQCEPVDYGSCVSMGGTMYGSTCCYDPGTTPNKETCLKCKGGYYLSGGTCHSCPKGYYCNGVVKRACPAGKYSEATGQVSCASCANLDDGADRYSSSEGATSCGSCKAEHNNDRSWIANSTHTGCVQDTVTCQNGEYKDADVCKPCPAGNYCNGTGVIPCPKGTYGAGEAVRSQCTACGANQYQDQTGQVSCKTCPGVVGDGGTSCTPRCGILNETQCNAASIYCEWKNGSCQIKQKACGDITDKTECQGRTDCEWDTSWTTYCHNKPVRLVSITDNTGPAYVTPDVHKTYILHALGDDGKLMGSNITWTVKASNSAALASSSCSAGNCKVVVKGWACQCTPPTATITVTAHHNVTGTEASTTIKVTSYGEWKKYDWNKEKPAGGLIWTTTALDSPVCKAYGGQKPDGTYANVYDRCCCGGGTKYNFCCKKDEGVGYSWKENQTKKECPTGYTIDESKNSNTCKIGPSACYKDSDGEYHWTNDPDSSWVMVSGISKEADCQKEEAPACYLKPEGGYEWGLFAKTDGYTKITAIKDEESCHEPADEACYVKDDDYKWASTPPEGYTIVEDATSPEECNKEEPACYVHGQKFEWGTYENVTGYIKLDEITSEDQCEVPEGEACYEDPEGNYVWGPYGDDDDYKLIPSVTDIGQCNNDVPTPSTAIDISKVVYVFMAILMAFGIGFIYYSSILKKNN